MKSFGGDGTLPMKVLTSPEGSTYFMKFGWKSVQKRTHLEHINEVVAAKIAELLGLDVIKAEIAKKDGQYGCLSLDYIEQYQAIEDETGFSLMEAKIGDEYNYLQSCSLKGMELLNLAFHTLEKFTYFKQNRQAFINMNLFDILIGNQDRHPSNWAILFRKNESFFGPLYDNGASLGFLLPDQKLEEMLIDDVQLDGYFNRMKVKAGVFHSRKPPIKAIDLLDYCNINYKKEVRIFRQALTNFSLDEYRIFLDHFPIYSEIRKKFVNRFIEHRRDKLISLIKEDL